MRLVISNRPNRPNRPDRLERPRRHLQSFNRCRVGVLAGLVSVLAGAASTAAAQTEPAECASGRPYASTSVDIGLPGGDPFSPPVAGADEPRISLGYVRTHITGSPAESGSGSLDFNAADVSAGSTFGLWARRRGCSELQVSLIGGVFAQFNMDAPSQALINSDFLIGGQLTHRRGPVSARVRVYHESSHLGDEFLLRNPGVARVNFSLQAIDGLLSLDGTWWRVYAGGGARFYSHADLERGTLRGGAEAGQRPTRGRRPALVGALDLTSHQALDWRTAVSGAVGLSWSGTANTRRLRALVVGFSGPAPWGQFFDERMRHAGVTLQFEF